MAFRDHGFLGKEAEAWVADARQNHKDLFQLAEEMHSFAHKALSQAHVPAEAGDEHRKRTISIALFIKIQNSFASIVRLVERGLCSDAEIILRSMFNAILLLVNLRLHHDFLIQFLGQDALYKRKQLRELSVDDPVFVERALGLTAERVAEELAKYDADILQNRIEQYSVFQLADDVDLKGAYSTMYRTLSNVEHSGLDSVSRHIKFAADGSVEALQKEPQTDLVKFILKQALVVFGAALESYAVLFEIPGRDAVKGFADRAAAA